MKKYQGKLIRLSPKLWVANKQCLHTYIHKVPGEVGHLCCVYMFGVGDDDTEESVAVAISVEASVPSDSLSPPLRLKLVPLRVSESLSISRLMVWSTMRA